MEKEINNTIETVENNDNVKTVPKKFTIFTVCYAAVAYLFMIVMWATGWNFFPLVAVVFAAVSALLILLSVIKWNKIGLDESYFLFSTYSFSCVFFLYPVLYFKPKHKTKNPILKLFFCYVRISIYRLYYGYAYGKRNQQHN